MFSDIDTPVSFRLPSRLTYSNPTRETHMQLMIDTTTESAEGLRRIAAILAFAAAQLDGAGPVSAAVIAAPSVPTGTAAAPALPPTFPPIGSVSPPVEVMKA